MTQERAVGTIPSSAVHFEAQPCGGMLRGSLRIDTVTFHVEAVRIAELGVVDMQERGEHDPTTVAYHTSAAGEADLLENDNPFCSCQVMVDMIYEADEDYSGNYQSGSIAGHTGNWLIIGTPFQQ